MKRVHHGSLNVIITIRPNRTFTGGIMDSDVDEMNL